MARDAAYQEAERRIEEARQYQTTELNLSHLGLTEVPEAIASLTQLQELDLFYNESDGVARGDRISHPIKKAVPFPKPVDGIARGDRISYPVANT